MMWKHPKNGAFRFYRGDCRYWYYDENKSFGVCCIGMCSMTKQLCDGDRQADCGFMEPRRGRRYPNGEVIA